MFEADDTMQTTGKSTLKTNLQVEKSKRNFLNPTSVGVDVLALLWTSEWPVHGTVTIISSWKSIVKQ